MYVTFVQCIEVRTCGNKAKGTASCGVDFPFCLCGSRAGQGTRYEALALCYNKRMGWNVFFSIGEIRARPIFFVAIDYARVVVPEL